MKNAFLGLIILTLLAAGVLGQPSESDENIFIPVEAAENVLVTLPNEAASVKFVATGDTGRGNRVQHDLGRRMAFFHNAFPFTSVILTGDNLYGPETPADYKAKFEDPYRTLLDRDVKFYATLGNHDEDAQINYKYFNMGGNYYYRYTEGNVAFYALNTNYLDPKQIDWLKAELAADEMPWKVAFFHHPPYSSGGRHGSDNKTREALHPIFVEHGVDVVFTGHDHFYERIVPQDGIFYFVTGAGGEVRSGDIRRNSKLTASGFDSDLSFMMVEVVGNRMHFQAVSRTGKTVDKGIIENRGMTKEAVGTKNEQSGGNCNDEDIRAIFAWLGWILSGCDRGYSSVNK